jgi:hypothetical protein
VNSIRYDVPTVAGQNVLIGFHAAPDRPRGDVSGPENAIVGSYLRTLGLGHTAIVGMTKALPWKTTWLEPNHATELGVSPGRSVGHDERP